MRLPPLPADQWDDRTRAALRPLLPRDRRNPDGAGPAMSTLARHPDLTEAFLRFGVYLLFQSSLPHRVRELAVLRVAHRTECAYEWHSHVDMAPQLGLSGDDITGVRNGRLADPLEQAVLDAVDELSEKFCLSDAVWSALGEHLTEDQRMDLIFTVGGYTTMAMAYNTFGVEPKKSDPAAPAATPFPDREQVV
ncbi:carboxymuconolactone decarboxylase family protein [Nocardia sp. BMG51109]|uniref:carboxymuconolactone decarboxylase family protein n=1 Tax=Nocardia sp. BMG51109 TaxID=1056816 RepID=UPI000464CB16|nr:carboxymuconolactone decarboxylase family protein [Nocardia sp. BMG51109]